MGLRKILHENLEYKETVRTATDKILADIYQLKSNKAYMLHICDVSHGKKEIIARKLRYEREGYDYQTIKDEIKEHFFNEAYLILHPVH